jgi:AsmA protein
MMKTKKYLIKSLVIAFSAGIVILALLLLSPFIFKERLEKTVKQTVNDLLLTELDFSAMDVSFIRHFPHLTISLSDVSLKSSAPFSADTLISAKEVAFGVNLFSLVSGPVQINKVYVDRGKITVIYNEKGESNYEVYNVSDSAAEETDTSAATTAIRIENIVFSRTDFVYSDPSIPLKIEALGISYRGKNEIANAIMNLSSRIRIDSLDLVYDQVPYIRSKPVAADLETRVDLKSFDMKLEKNDLTIKDIPFEFKGELNFRKNGYEIFIALFSQFDEEYLSGSFWMKSSDSLWMSVKADVNVTIENWIRGLAIKEMDMRGHFNMKLHAEGNLTEGQNPKNPEPDTIFLSIPDFNLTARMENGYFHYTGLPEAIKNISFDLSASVTNHDYRTLNLKLGNLKAGFMNNQLSGFFRIDSLEGFPVEAGLSTRLNLAELKQVIPLDSLDLKGMLDLNLDMHGSYSPEKHLFPLTTLSLTLSDGEIRTRYYPQPVENVQLAVTLVNQTGDLKGTRMQIDPLSFSFAGSPFEFRGEFSDPEDLIYAVESNGSIDLAGMYHLFSQEGMDLAGFISTGLTLKGTQRDALAGNWDRIEARGKLVLRDIAFSSEYLPLPLILKSGVFRFQNDRVWFERFDCRYGESSLSMDGYLSNVINYLLTKDQPLKGNFTFRSEYLLVDEFLSEVDSSQFATDNSHMAPGVIVIPANLEIGLKTEIRKIRFEGLEIKDLASDVEIKKGLLLLKSASFDLIGCKVAMDATYGNISPARAFFNFHITANDFDIRRAYNEVELFRNLASSAGKCEGIVSLDYALKGKLGPGMTPVYPSLEGGGVLSLKQVKVMGLNLFTAMSRNLEREEIRDPDLSKVDLKTTIKDNVITLERRKMKMAGFRFRVEGQTNFDGKINLKTRLGLPPLGIVGIPIRVLGTLDNPKFKYGRGTSDEEVETIEYVDEIPPEMLEMIREAKEETGQEEGEE